MIVIKMLVQEIIMTVISVYAPECVLDNSLINIVRKLREKEIVVIAGDFNYQVVSHPGDYEDQHRGYGYGVRNKEGKRILEFCAAMNMAPRNSVNSDFRSYVNMYKASSQKYVSVEG